MVVTISHNARLFTKSVIITKILEEVIASLPSKSTAYLVGGAARNSVYFDLFNKSLPQRDYDLLFVGDLKRFIENLRKYKFVYGKIRRKNEIVLKKKLVPNPKSLTDYFFLDIGRSYDTNILNNLKFNSAFTINGFAIPLRKYLFKNSKKFLISLPKALDDLRDHRLRLNISGYRKHPGNLFACLRFISIGFTPPNKREVQLLLDELPKLEKRRFARNVRKVFNYVGGETKARRLAKKLGIKIDIFNFNELKKFEGKICIN